MAECVNPDAKIYKCVICGQSVISCNKNVQNNTGCCPVHPHYNEIKPGHWVCSEVCWEVAAGAICFKFYFFKSYWQFVLKHHKFWSAMRYNLISFFTFKA